MASQELMFPVGWLDLTEEQSNQVKSALGRSVTSLALFRVVAIAPADRFIPIVGTPGVEGVVIHYGEHKAELDHDKQGRNLIASILQEMAVQPQSGAYFAAHTKLMAPRAEQQARPEQQPKPEQAKGKDDKAVIAGKPS